MDVRGLTKRPVLLYAGSRSLASLSVLPPEEFAIASSGLAEPPDAIALELSSDPDVNRPLLKDCLKRFRRPVLALVPPGSFTAAVDAVRNGAKDALEEPLKPETLLASVRGLFPKPKEGNPLGEEPVLSSLGQIIGAAPSMQTLYKRMLSVSPSDATVLIQGPSGTGKELVARAIHNNSRRAAGPFVAINCGAIPANLLESELFGHERGSFTGAAARHEGKFKQADGGTIFLDEIAELPLDLQVKLLRVLQEMAVTRVGGSETVPIDARVVCATNRELQDLLAKGLFREDLYYRLNVVPIRTPALSERKQDIPLLLNHFLSFFADKYAKRTYDFSMEAMAKLCAYSWPGNVREMENLVERIVVLHDAAIVDESFLPEEVLHAIEPARKENETAKSRSQATVSFHAVTGDEIPLMPLDEAEAALLKAALRRTGGNISLAAKILKIGQATAYRKLKKYAIDAKAHKPSIP